MKKATFLFFLSLVCNPHSAAQWYQQPSPSGETLWSVRFINEEIGWILGGLGHIFKTTDGGGSWVEQDAWNGGGWALLPLNNDTVFYSRFIDTLEFLRRTTDGGLNWETVDSLGRNSWYDELEFINERTGFVVGKVDTGSGGLFMIRKTTDGGETWVPIWMDEHDPYGLTGVSFVDSLNGWIAAYREGVFRTSDGGNTWTRAQPFDSTTLWTPYRDLEFTTVDSGWVVGGIGGDQMVSRTTDAGMTWVHQTVPFGSSLREVQMLNSQVGWFVGSVNQPPYIARTNDGGVTWIEQEIQPPNSGFESISMINDTLGWVVGSEGVYKTTNGGVTWVSPVAEVPLRFVLHQNHPNPFNPTTEIGFQIPDFGFVSLVIYDLVGQKVATLVNERLTPGTYTRHWDATGQPSGVYFYRLQAGGFVETRKLVLLR